MNSASDSTRPSHGETGGTAPWAGFNVMLAGGVNLTREPRNGRNFEYAGEDPLLAGITAGSIIAGIQSQHVVSTVNHYALNDQETGRGIYDVDISVQDARESDLLAFEIAIERGNPGAVMCAYNKVDGAFSCENKLLLTDLLKGAWRYPGWVMSDWGGVHSTVDAANNVSDPSNTATVITTGTETSSSVESVLNKSSPDAASAPTPITPTIPWVSR